MGGEAFGNTLRGEPLKARGESITLAELLDNGRINYPAEYEKQKVYHFSELKYLGRDIRVSPVDVSFVLKLIPGSCWELWPDRELSFVSSTQSIKAFNGNADIIYPFVSFFSDAGEEYRLRMHAYVEKPMPVQVSGKYELIIRKV